MAFTAADVKNLREMTGVGMMDCKKALTASDGDMDKAVEWLREKGMAASAKKAGRIAAEGMAYGRGGRGQRRDRLRGQEREVRGLRQGRGRHCGQGGSRRPGRADGVQVRRHRPDRHPAAAGDGAGDRREHQGPPLRPLRRERLRALCARRRQDRCAGEPGVRPAR